MLKSKIVFEMLEVNRPYLIFWTLGFVSAKKEHVTMTDKIITMDTMLQNLGQPAITDDEKKLFRELEGEIEYAILAAGINRKQSRKLGGKSRC